jgi:hypothetical protein
MPRNKPSDTREVRITLGNKERQFVESIINSYRLQVLDPNQIREFLEHPEKIIALLYGIATVFEVFGVETGLPTLADAPEVVQWFRERDLAKEIRFAAGIASDSPAVSKITKLFSDIIIEILGGDA